MPEQANAASSGSSESLFSDVPSDPGEMTEVVVTSLGDLWADFLARLPFLAAEIVAIVLTWAVARVIRYALRRFLIASRFRRSLRDLLMQLTSVAVWVTGIVVTAVIVFPGMTPSKVLAGLGIGSVALGFAFKDIV